MNFALIGSYGLQMTITFAVALAVWTLKVMASNTDTFIWYRVNAARIAIAVASFWLMAAALVVVPNIAALLGALGFNADQSAAGIALAITGFVIKNKVSNTPPADMVKDLSTGASGDV